MNQTINHLLKKHKNFIKFILIGIANITFMTLVLWFFVDIAGFMAAQINPLLYVVVFFLKFYAYRKTRMFNSHKYNFTFYLFIALGALLLSTLALWIFVDKMGFFVWIVNPIIVVIITLMRFKAFKAFKMLEG